MATAQANGPPPNVVPCRPGCMPLATRLRGEDRAQWQSRGDRLGHGDDVGRDPVLLVSEPLAGASQAALDFIEDQERAGFLREFARGLQKLRAYGIDSAFALNRLQANRADAAIELALQIFDIVKAYEAHARKQAAQTDGDILPVPLWPATQRSGREKNFPEQECATWLCGRWDY